MVDGISICYMTVCRWFSIFRLLSKRTWYAGKPKKKPDYNPETITEELLEAVVNAYEFLFSVYENHL